MKWRKYLQAFDVQNTNIQQNHTLQNFESNLKEKWIMLHKNLTIHFVSRSICNIHKVFSEKITLGVFWRWLPTKLFKSFEVLLAI